MEQFISLSTNFESFYINNSLGEFSTGDFYPSVWPAVQPLVERYYYQYPIFYSNLNDTPKLEKAFKISQMLIDKKIVNLKTVQDFIDLVNNIVEVI